MFYIAFLQDVKKRFDFEDIFLTSLQHISQTSVLDGEVNSIVQFVLRFFPGEQKNIEVINKEYRALADCEYIKKFRNACISEFWAEIGLVKNECNEFMFSNIYRIVQGAFCIPHSSANVERIFSYQNVIKTRLRNRMQVETCSALIETKNLIKNECCHSFIVKKNSVEQKSTE